MELWLIPLLIAFAVILGWGSLTTMNRRKLTDRQQRWRELDRRFDQITMESTQVETDPQRALAAPGWLDRSNPLVRGFASTLRRAQQRRLELERNTTAATAQQQKKVQKALGSSSDTASSLAPTEEEIDRYALVVEQLEDAYAETDRAVRLTGWTRPGDHRLPHAQFMLDHRWGRPAVYPHLPVLDDQGAEVALKSFLDATFPVHRDSVITAVRNQASAHGVTKRAQKALEQLVSTQRYRVDAEGFLWPSSVSREQWGAFRTFGRSADLSLHDVPTLEIANAAWVVLGPDRELEEDELLVLVSERLEVNLNAGPGWAQSLNDGLSKGMKSLPASMQRMFGDSVPTGLFGSSSGRRLEERLQQGLHEGLVSGRLQRQVTGRIARLRTGWPTTYR